MKSEDKHLFYFITTNQLSETEKKWIQSKKRRRGILEMDQKGSLKLVKGLTYLKLKPNIIVDNVTFYDYVLKKEKIKAVLRNRTVTF